jgi:ribosomal protein L7/L12
MSFSLSAGDLQRVQEALRSKGLIEAVKIYRMITGQGLAESKSAVDAIQAGHVPPSLPATTNAAEPATPPSPPPLDALHLVRDALRRGNKIEAIKHYRDLTKSALAEAKRAVEAMEAGLSRPQAAVSTYRPPPLPSPADDEGGIHAALYRGNKTEAIKIYRETHHVGLDEAKLAVDAMEDELRGKRRATSGSRPSLTIGRVIVFVIAIAVLYFVARAVLR